MIYMKKTIATIILIILVVSTAFSVEAKRLTASSVELSDLDEGTAVVYIWSIADDEAPTEAIRDETKLYGNRGKNVIGEDGTWTIHRYVYGRVAIVVINGGHEELFFVEAE